MNDLSRIVSNDNGGIMEAASAALGSGWWLNGKQTVAFVEEFAAYIGAAHCLGVANGTDALEISMRALMATGRANGSEVVTVANAGGYSTIAARQIGLVPVYADIDRASQLLDFASAVSLLSGDTAFVVATHLYGGIVDVPRLRMMLDEAGHAGVPILEDCAQAHGVRLGPEVTASKAGSLGDIATFSFYPTKNLGAFGDGGAIVSSDADLMKSCAMLAQYGWSSKYNVAVPGGRNSRLDEVQAAILRRLLPHLDTTNAQRVDIMDRYTAAAPKSLDVVRSPAGTVGHLALVLSDDRKGLASHLDAAGVGWDIHYPVLDCDQMGWRDLPQRMAANDIAVSRESVGQILSLPCFPTMRDDEIERVCTALSLWTG